MWIDGYTGGNENFIGILSIISCVGNIIIKSFIGILLYKQYTDTKNLESENKNNYY